MRSRSLRILLLGVFSLWFGVIVPGHERGAIRMPGTEPKAAAGEPTCHTQKNCQHCPTTGQPLTPSDNAPADPSSHCAICHFIGVLDAPVALTFTIPEAELLASLPPTAYQSIAGVAVLSVDRGRGPPTLFI
jgi:hypothetical protein